MSQTEQPTNQTGSTWFLKSKRFWAAIITSGTVGTVLAKVPAANDFVVNFAEACCGVAPEHAAGWAAGIIVSAIVGFVGMGWGKRGVTLLPPPKPPKP